MELKTGATVGRFRLEREVARGGMGAVWAARDPAAPGRLVAVKTVIAAKSSKKLSQLFVEEARIARAVRHPNLVELYDAGEENGVPYLAMEWVEGLTLRALAQAPGDLPLGVILRICMEACDGLHAVHEARTDDGKPLQIVHRDVSPHNLLVSIAGRVKVIDFGIAKARGRLASETTDGVLRGKIRYMAPEHARGAELDRRADVWSLGVTLLEVTTGMLPFSGEHDVATLVQLLSAEPKVPDHPMLPACVKRVVERALRRKPEERYANARAMGTDLEAAIVTLGDKVTRRDVAHCVRMRIETARTQAIRVPSFEVDDEDEDGAPTALFLAPRPAPPPQALAPTKTEILPAPVAPPRRTPSSPSLVAPLTNAVDELLEEDLTEIRPVDVVMASAIPGRLSSSPPVVVPAPPPLPAAPRAPIMGDDGDTTNRLSSPPLAPEPSSPPLASSPPPPPPAAPAVLAQREAVAAVDEGSRFPSSAPPPRDLVVGGPATTTSAAVWEPAPPVSSGSPSKLVPALAALLVVVFAAIGALIAVAAGESAPASPGSSASPNGSAPDDAVVIGVVRAPLDAAAPKPKK